MTFEEWKQLAEQGDANAEYHLGLMYDKGSGVPQDDAKAIKFYRRAAERGDPEAQAHLGDMYMNGKRVPQDYVKARMWLNLAQGLPQGRKALNVLAERMTPVQIWEAQRLTREWKPKK